MGKRTKGKLHYIYSHLLEPSRHMHPADTLSRYAVLFATISEEIPLLRFSANSRAVTGETLEYVCGNLVSMPADFG